MADWRTDAVRKAIKDLEARATANQIAEKTGLSAYRVRWVLHYGMMEGVFERVKRGVYRNKA